MVQISTVEARERLAEVVNRAAFGGERVVLTRRGKELAAIVPMEDLRWLEEYEDRIDIEDADAALAEAREKGTISLEEFKAQLGL
ncbi:MAG: type II toxin-antitoxin system Phd/YefM family antitoxin [Thermomicrobiales bacterium]